MKLGGGNSKICYVHPYLGKWSILTDIFQMGWSHQLGNIEEVVCRHFFLEGTGLTGARNDSCFLILHALLKYVKQCVKIIQNRMFAVCFSKWVVHNLWFHSSSILQLHTSSLSHVWLEKITTTAWNICIRELLCVYTKYAMYAFKTLNMYI